MLGSDPPLSILESPFFKTDTSCYHSYWLWIRSQKDQTVPEHLQGEKDHSMNDEDWKSLLHSFRWSFTCFLRWAEFGWLQLKTHTKKMSDGAAISRRTNLCVQQLSPWTHPPWSMLGNTLPWRCWTLQRNTGLLHWGGARVSPVGHQHTIAMTVVWQGACLPPQRGCSDLQRLLQDDLTQIRLNL